MSLIIGATVLPTNLFKNPQQNAPCRWGLQIETFVYLACKCKRATVPLNILISVTAEN